MGHQAVTRRHPGVGDHHVEWAGFIDHAVDHRRRSGSVGDVDFSPRLRRRTVILG
jgi:hypothetical protein